MTFCLPKFAADVFKGKLVSGEIDPAKLSSMSSEERRTFFKEFLGDENAKQVNALFESKLLLKNQQQGIINWAKSIAGMKPEVLRDILSKVDKMTEVLSPKNEKAFLADLAEKKLGVGVSVEEAGKIVDLSKQATDAKAELAKTPYDKQAQINYGNKYLDLTEYTESLKPKGNLFSFSNIVNLPKSALTSILHFSASFVQGWGMISTPEFWSAFGHQFKYFADAKEARNLDASIIAHPDYQLAKDGKLGITHISDQLSSREEAIQSSLLEHVPGLRVLVKASSRAFTGMLNDLRFSRFVNLLDAARLNGEDVRKGSSVVRDIAKVVNDFTGRGALGTKDRYASIQPLANSLFFSPRKIAATIEMFDPVRYLDPRISPTARMAALRQLSGSLLATGAVLTLANLAGAKVNLDPRSTNFAKIQIGGTTFDMTGGNAVYIRLLARIVTGQSISSSGKLSDLTSGKFGSQTRADLAISFLRDKLSPTASAVADALYGKNPVGQPFSIPSEAYEKLTPIIIQDYINMAQNDPNDTAAWLPAVSAIFGVGLTSTPKKK